MAQWVALVAIWIAILAVTGAGFVVGLVAMAAGGAAVGAVLWWAHRRLAALPPEWISVAFDDDGLHVDTQTATYPGGGGGVGGPAGATGVRTSSSNLIAWDAIRGASRTDHCIALTIAGERHVVIPVTAFGEPDRVALEHLLLERGLLTSSR